MSTEESIDADASCYLRSLAKCNEASTAMRGSVYFYEVSNFDMHPLVQQNREILTALCSRHGVRRLEIFGSAADAGRGAAVNDFDFLVEFQPCSPSAHSSSYFGLLFDLEDTFKQPVDLVELRAVTNPFFLQSIEPHRQVLFAA